MVANLMNKSNMNVSVFDTNQEVLQLASRQGAFVTDSPMQAAADANYLITMLPGNKQVLDVYASIFQSETKMKPGAICIDCSTVDPSVSQTVQELAIKHGNEFLDAPVSGGVGGATTGSLTFMVGGKTQLFEEVKVELLSHMGGNIVHCGELAGSGEIAKLCNNLILGVSMAAVSEAMNLGRTLGVDPAVLAGVINSSSGRCWSSDTYNPCPGILPNVPSSKGYEGGFASALMLKDLKLACEAAEKSGASIPMGNRVEQLYTKLGEEGLGGKDFSIVYDFHKNHAR